MTTGIYLPDVIRRLALAAFVAAAFDGMQANAGDETFVSPDVAQAEAAAATAPSNTWTRMLDLLREHNILHDPLEMQRPVMQAMLRVIDRHAEILSIEEAEVLRMRNQGLLAPDSLADTNDEEPARLLPLRAERWPRGITYIKINGMYENAGEYFCNAAGNFLSNGYAGLIMDLRDAGGVNLDAVDKIAAYFVDPGKPLYRVQATDGKLVRSSVADGNDLMRLAGPTIVLTGNRTSKAAELLAAILKEARGVMLLGERTRGDPRIREFLKWSDNEILYLATSVIHPDCHDDYELVGIVPHVTAPAGRAGGKQRIDTSGEFDDYIDRDPLLARAVDVLIGLEAIR